MIQVCALCRIVRLASTVLAMSLFAAPSQAAGDDSGAWAALVKGGHMVSQQGER